MIKLIQSEVDAIRKAYPNKHLQTASKRKKGYGSKTYWLLCDDKESLRILSKLRKKSIKEIVSEM